MKKNLTSVFISEKIQYEIHARTCASLQEIVYRFQALFERSDSHLQAYAYATFEAKEVFIVGAPRNVLKQFTLR